MGFLHSIFVFFFPFFSLFSSTDNTSFWSGSFAVYTCLVLAGKLTLHSECSFKLRARIILPNLMRELEFCCFQCLTCCVLVLAVTAQIVVMHNSFTKWNVIIILISVLFYFGLISFYNSTALVTFGPTATNALFKVLYLSNLHPPSPGSII